MCMRMALSYLTVMSSFLSILKCGVAQSGYSNVYDYYYNDVDTVPNEPTWEGSGQGDLPPAPYADWHIGEDWSECSSTCGASYRYRTVQCIQTNTVVYHGTHEESAPNPNRDMYEYFYVTLDPSSEYDLYGESQTNNSTNTTAPNSTNTTAPNSTSTTAPPLIWTAWSARILEDEFCGRKPLHTERCDTPLCQPEWVAENWTQCDPWCGSIGFRTRTIRCISGPDTEEPMVFSPFMCHGKVRPPRVSMCDNGPCRRMKWDTGDWSECSSYCGRGRQIRRVSCVKSYTGERVIPSHCRPKLRPSSRRACEGTCEEGSGFDLACHDNPNAKYCTLVLRFRLCSNDFYHNMCCVTCRARSYYPFLIN